MKVFPQHRKLVVPFRADVENLLSSHVTRFETGGAHWLAVPHEIPMVRVLRNMGFKAPSPIHYRYDWNLGTPFLSQKVTADLLTISPRCYVLSEMGVGKTRAVLYALDFLMREGLVKNALVVAPLSTLTTVWDNEIFENFPHLTTGVLYGDRKKRLKVLGRPANVYIINHNGIEVIHQELFKRTDIDTVVIDELAIYRNARTDHWKFLRPLVERSKYAWGLTGSPVPNEPSDAYGQIKLLTPDRVGYSFKSFRDQTMRQVAPFRWTPKKDALKTVYESMQPGIRFTRDQCFDLPPTTYSTREVALAPLTAKTYKRMFDELSIQVRNKEIVASNEGVKLNKLLQIAAGFAYDSDGEGQYIGGLERIRAVIEAIESAPNKVIVFAPFRYIVDLIGGVLAKKFTTAIVHGQTPKATRDMVYAGFQRSVDPRVIVAHPGCMAHGLTLTAADTIIWAVPTTSPEIYEQANARITRPGQKHSTHIINVQATPAEKKVYDRLKRKAKMQGTLLELFENSDDSMALIG